jgi:hypothetical protein
MLVHLQGKRIFWIFHCLDVLPLSLAVVLEEQPVASEHWKDNSALIIVVLADEFDKKINRMKTDVGAKKGFCNFDNILMKKNICKLTDCCMD